MIRPQAIFFDFDGTLADTAPDLCGAANNLRAAHGQTYLAYEALRPYASAGARGLVGQALGKAPGDEGYEALRDEFLQIYEARIVKESTLFDGVPDMLYELQANGILWGIVTNKSTKLTRPIVQHFQLEGYASLVCGDTTPHTKPHPAPLLHAATQADVAPALCWYIGDDLRDIQAARAAGMNAIAAAYGYCGSTEPLGWGADAVVKDVPQLMALIAQYTS